MMTVLQRLAGGVLVTAVAVLAGVGLAGGARTESVTLTAPAASVVRDGRTIFDARARPQLVLPNGARRSIASILKVDGRLHFGEFVWNDSGVPAGRLWVRIDQRAQMISVFRGPHEIGTSLILYGADEKPTPAGVFPVLARLRHHRSSLYDAEMPYTLRLTHDGVAIHASGVRSGAATHGCIGVPEGFAARLFAAARVGDEVVILNGRKPAGGAPAV